MAKLELNAIFYSKGNMDLAYTLKKSCRELGISLIYAFDVPQLVRFINDIEMGIIFIDCGTLKINENILNFIKSYPNSKNSLIICIMEDDCDGNDPDHLVDGWICSKNLFEDLRKKQNFIYSKLSQQITPDYDPNEVNDFLTTYLITVGLVPKHIGFSYIKQSIELALKRGIIGSLSKEIYPTVASKNKTFAQNVERNIRNAIECACHSPEMNRDPIHMLISNGKISNRAFLCYLLDKAKNNLFKTVK